MICFDRNKYCFSFFTIKCCHELCVHGYVVTLFTLDHPILPWNLSCRRVDIHAAVLALSLPCLWGSVANHTLESHQGRSVPPGSWDDFMCFGIFPICCHIGVASITCPQEVVHDTTAHCDCANTLRGLQHGSKQTPKPKMTFSTTEKLSKSSSKC